MGAELRIFTGARSMENIFREGVVQIAGCEGIELKQGKAGENPKS